MPVVFASAFIAEPGDRTRLATLLFAADSKAGRLTLFPGFPGASPVRA